MRAQFLGQPLFANVLSTIDGPFFLSELKSISFFKNM